MRPGSLSVFVALALLLPSARAGNLEVHASIGKTFPINFDLGFKLPCKHNYTLMYTDDTIVEQLKPSETTTTTVFKFRANKVGMTTITAMFVGIGGNCNGSAMTSVDVMVMPDQKFTEKSWKTAIKTAEKDLHDGLDDAAGAVEDEVHSIMESFDAGALTSAQAADAVVDAITDGTVGAGFACYLALQEASGTGSSLLADGGFTSTLPLFQSGSRGSLWDDFEYHAREDYDAWVEDAYDFLDDTLDHIAKKRGTFSYVSYFDRSLSLEVPQGPGVATDPVDAPQGAARIVGGVAWNDNGNGSLRWVGTGLLDNGDVKVDVLGPTGFTAQHPQLPQTAVGVSAPFGKWKLSVDSLSLGGTYRLEVRYLLDDTIANKVSVTLPGF